MNGTIQLQAKVHFRRGRAAKKMVGAAETPPAPTSAGRLPRVARLLALAHRFESLVQEGAVRDYADLARLGHVTRARVSQIMNLLNLAPDLQEQILCSAPMTAGDDRVTERQLRRIAATLDWTEQRALWQEFG